MTHIHDDTLLFRHADTDRHLPTDGHGALPGCTNTHKDEARMPALTHTYPDVEG